MNDPGSRTGEAITPLWVPNPDDSPDLPALLDTSRARAAGIALIHLSPLTGARRTEFARDVLRSLDAPAPATRDEPRITAADLPGLALARLCGHRVRHMVIDRGHLVREPLLETARDWCAHLGARLWLLNPTPDSGTGEQRWHHDRLRRLASHDLTPAEVRTWAPELTTAALPDTDFPLFRIDCHRRTGDLFPLIDEVFTTTFQHVLDHPLALRAAHQGDAQQSLCIATALTAHHLAYDHPPPPVRLIRLRAIQAALWRHHNMLLRWEPPTLLPHPARHLPGTALSQQACASISKLADPIRATAWLLSALLETSPRQLSTLPASALQTDPEPWLALGAAEVSVPPPVHPVLRTFWCYTRHQHHRHNAGLDLTTPDARLFCHRGRYASPQTLFGLLNKTPTDWVTDDGLALSREQLRSRFTTWPEEWLRIRKLGLRPFLVGVQP